MYASQHDGGAALFSGGGFMPSQATQTPESGFSKSRGVQGVIPLTVKQISEAYHSNDDKSNFIVDGVEAGNVRLLGLVMNKAERVTDVTFTLDDGTGRIDVNRWVNETSDTNEMAVIQNGMYVVINGSLKGFQGKKHVVAFSVRPVVDFNHITLHFIECIHVHLDNTRPKGAGLAQAQTGSVVQNTIRSDVKEYQSPVSHQFSSATAAKASETDASTNWSWMFFRNQQTLLANMDCMWMKLFKDWAYRSIRLRMQLITMLMLVISILLLMTTTSSLHATADGHLVHLF
ncbi:hypothetical protein J5N97_016341 [Dioscorea zingiberensis]|uniref:OB domain-containing protein n=1 Tax=Dioscorea zingiberensis TaxID=325984 RepID=A0A9D5CJ73_9LILI|nr:hypothetical protein J5N97_016341 [Dioscorea zingiberensis]